MEQSASTGSGPLLERRYFIDVERSRKSPAQLMAEVQADVSRFSPDALADFKKETDDDDPIKTGDEFHITIFGPWNGSVRVTDVSATSFEFITCKFWVLHWYGTESNKVFWVLIHLFCKIIIQVL